MTGTVWPSVYVGASTPANFYLSKFKFFANGLSLYMEVANWEHNKHIQSKITTVRETKTVRFQEGAGWNQNAVFVFPRFRTGNGQYFSCHFVLSHHEVLLWAYDGNRTYFSQWNVWNVFLKLSEILKKDLLANPMKFRKLGRFKWHNVKQIWKKNLNSSEWKHWCAARVRPWYLEHHSDCKYCTLSSDTGHGTWINA